MILCTKLSLFSCMLNRSRSLKTRLGIVYVGASYSYDLLLAGDVLDPFSMDTEKMTKCISLLSLVLL